MYIYIYICMYNYFRFAKVMNHTTIINMFNSNSSNITYINTQHSKTMPAIAYNILRFESLIKNPIMANH